MLTQAWARLKAWWRPAPTPPEIVAILATEPVIVEVVEQDAKVSVPVISNCRATPAHRARKRRR